MFRNAHANRPEIAALAIRTVLRGALALNRFNAMDTFNALLKSVRSPELAVAIAGVLAEPADDSTLVERLNYKAHAHEGASTEARINSS